MRSCAARRAARPPARRRASPPRRTSSRRCAASSRPATGSPSRWRETTSDGSLMDVWLVTGGAGFIGSNVVRLALGRTGAIDVVLDKLTYAGNLECLAHVAGRLRLLFVHADIADRSAVEHA